MRRNSFGQTAASVGLCALALTASAAPQSAPQGGFYGQVVDAVTGKAVADATVALQDKHHHVLAWTKTDPQGHYALAANSIALLDLPTARRRGMLAAIGRGFVQVVQLPVKAVGAAVGVASDTVKAIDPVGTVKAAAVGMVAGSPLPLAAKASSDVQNLTGSDTQQRARTTAAQAVINGSPAPRANAKPKDMPGPGEVGLLISAPQYKEFRAPAGAYWLDATGSMDHGQASAAQAWLDTVRLAPATGDKNSDVQDQAVHLTDPTLDAALAAAGSTVKITVHLQTPTEPAVKVRVVAREQRTHQVAELMPQGNGVYAGSLTLDPKMPLGDTTVTIAALKDAPVDTPLPSGKEGDPLLALAAHLESLDADKPYRFDPRVTAGENRIDLKMTILDPKQESQAAPPPPAPTPAAASPPAAAPPATTPAPAPAPATPPKPAGH